MSMRREQIQKIRSTLIQIIWTKRKIVKTTDIQEKRKLESKLQYLQFWHHDLLERME